MHALLKKERLALAARPVVVPQSLPAPIKGWNTRDALDAMDPLDAVTLDNFYPDANGVNLRMGYELYTNVDPQPAFSSGFSSGFLSSTLAFNSPVKTLAEYNAGSTRKFLAACAGCIFDVSSPSTSILGRNFGSDIWNTCDFLARLFLANGNDTMQVFDGTSLANAAFTGGSTPALNTIVGVVEYQQRLFFWQSNSTGFWFAALNSISGELSFYDLAAFSPRGGNVVSVTGFSHDGGNGVQDFIVFILSSGDCLIFFGNDPSNANDWSLVGRYRISPPVSPRAVARYGAEAFVTTFDDHVPLQQQLVALKLGQLPPRSKVSTAVQAAVKANAAGFGWQALYYPAGRRLIFNIPNPDGSFDQHVCNTGVPAQPWCRFLGMKAYCWGLFKDALYFGSDSGNIYQADTGNMDVLGAVSGLAQQAWNALEDPNRKHLKAVRPVLAAIGTESASFGTGFDFGEIDISNAIALTALGSPWDTSPWDTSPWSSDTTVTVQWRLSGGTGTAIGLALTAATVQPLTWLRTDLRYERGSAL